MITLTKQDGFLIEVGSSAILYALACDCSRHSSTDQARTGSRVFLLGNVELHVEESLATVVQMAEQREG